MSALVEDDPSHPLWKTLGVVFGAGGRPVQVAEANIEDWQAEAHRLEQQGKLEQAEAIRATVLKLQPVPWTVTRRGRVNRLGGEGPGPSGGVEQSEAAAVRLRLLPWRRSDRRAPGRRAICPGRALPATGPPGRAPPAESYEARNVKDVLWQTEQHGVDFRTPMNLTPLMAAAYAGNARLVEACTRPRRQA